MKQSILWLLVVVMLTFVACSTYEQTEANEENDITSTTYTSLSKRFINTLRIKGDVQPILDSIANVEEAVLAAELINDDSRKAFWINVYNGYIQVLLQDNPELYKARGAFFRAKRITVAGKKLSFDDIEHGIIRRSKIKLSLGLLSKWNISDYEKKFRCDQVDPRVHFALNCGAKSCPAVVAYDAKQINEQMDKSTINHLQATSKYDKETNRVYITSLFNWFRGDFGNKVGIRQFLKVYEVLPEDANKTAISYNTYDWTLYLENYIDL